MDRQNRSRTTAYSARAATRQAISRNASWIPCSGNSLGHPWGDLWWVLGRLRQFPSPPRGCLVCPSVCLWAYVSDGEVGLALRWVRPCLYFRSVWWRMAGPILRVCLLLTLGSCSLSCARVRGRPAIARVCLPVNLRVRCGVGPALASLLRVGRVTGGASVRNLGGRAAPACSAARCCF